MSESVLNSNTSTPPANIFSSVAENTGSSADPPAASGSSENPPLVLGKLTAGQITDQLLRDAVYSIVKDSGAITKLKTLTTVRKVVLRAGIKALNLTRNPNREAVIAQAVGSTVQARCSHCSRGEGAFTECVQATVDGELLLQGSCASCHANSTGTRCSLRRKL